MTELLAASALGKANAFFSGGDGKAMLAIHEGLSNEVLQEEGI